ncbi:MAG: DUF488 domain-containing protein, partial [Acidobacteriota bacterium]|nr:DUF488 domain-containing protein [Acidobacteriota bacterium]
MPSKQNVRPLVLFTIGHSTRPLPDFLKILNVFGVKQLADIRTIPRSRHNPQYNQEKLAGDLSDAGMRYIHIDALGGLRHARRDSVNQGWRNASFRGYADYMQQPEFE